MAETAQNQSAERGAAIRKETVFVHLLSALRLAQERTGIPELNSIERAVSHLHMNRDEYADGYARAVLETLKDTEQNPARKTLWVATLADAIGASKMTIPGPLNACLDDINLHIAEIDKLEADHVES